MLDSSKLGQKIAELREARGLTQEELAKLAGVDKSYISLLEAGRRGAKANLETISKLARALRVSADELLAAAGYIRSGKPEETAFLIETYLSLPPKKKALVDSFLSTVATMPVDFSLRDEGRDFAGLPIGFFIVPTMETRPAY